MSLNSVVNKLVRAAASVPENITDTDLDAHVARILAAEAKANDQKWSELGLGAYMNSGSGRDSPDPSLPKPNKRFLQSVIRTVDGHNQALLRQQAQAASDARGNRNDSMRREARSGASRLFGGALAGMGRESSRGIRRTDASSSRDHRRHGSDSDTPSRRGEPSKRRRSRSRERDRSDDATTRSSRDRSADRRDRRRNEREYDRSDQRREKERVEGRRSGRRDSDSDEESERRSSRARKGTDDHSRKHRDRYDSDGKRQSRRRRDRERSKSQDRDRERRSERDDSRLGSKDKSRSGRERDESDSDRHRRHSPRSRPSRKIKDQPPPPDSPPPPSPPLPGREPISRMDKYFTQDYDPRFDVGEVPRTGIVTDVGWDSMLSILKERGKKRRRNSPGLSPSPEPVKRDRLPMSAALLSSVPSQAPEDSKSVMDMEYTPRGGMRAWDVGKEL